LNVDRKRGKLIDMQVNMGRFDRIMKLYGVKDLNGISGYLDAEELNK